VKKEGRGELGEIVAAPRELPMPSHHTAAQITRRERGRCKLDMGPSIAAGRLSSV
jgi:hypothetical protein